MKTISREQLRRGLENDEFAAVIEVLDPEHFDEFHLPGAINIPVGDDFENAVQAAVPDKSAAVVVYCQDEDCPASPTAARKMDELGYEQVYDYEAGKIDWRDANLPIET